MEEELKHLGNLSGLEPWYLRHMSCFDCGVSWTGSMDSYLCPKCGEGELPSSGLPELGSLKLDKE